MVAVIVSGVRRLSAVVLLSLGILGAVPAVAQISPFDGTGFELTKEDITILNNESMPIFQDPPVPLNSRYDWTNPSSGNSGAVTLLSRFKRGDLPCVRVRYDIKVHDVGKPFRYDLSYCRVADGQWKAV